MAPCTFTATSPSAPTFFNTMVRLKNDLIEEKDIGASLHQLTTMNIGLDAYKSFDLEETLMKIGELQDGQLAKVILQKYRLLEKKEAMVAKLTEKLRKRTQTTASKQQTISKRSAPMIIAPRPRVPLAKKEDPPQLIPAKSISAPTKKESDEDRKLRLDQLIQKSRVAVQMKKASKENRLQTLIVAPSNQEPAVKKAKYSRKS